jgi:hypothetical protein
MRGVLNEIKRRREENIDTLMIEALDQAWECRSLGTWSPANVWIMGTVCEWVDGKNLHFWCCSGEFKKKEKIGTTYKNKSVVQGHYTTRTTEVVSDDEGVSTRMKSMNISSSR